VGPLALDDSSALALDDSLPDLSAALLIVLFVELVIVELAFV